MSRPERFVRDHKRQTDCAIHRAFAQLAFDPLALEKFRQLLLCARKRAVRLFEAPVFNGRHPGVDALVHLSRFSGAHIRRVSEWEGATGSWRAAIASLAHHLVCEYRVPVFLASSWYATDAAGDQKRGWFVSHARGIRFRSLNLPLPMTRKMEHIFLASPDHLSLEHAMRRAELLSLGAPADLLKAILATRLGTDLSQGEFWRTVWMFLIENAADVDPAQVGPMIDYIQAVRHDRVAVETANGAVQLEPLAPGFSMKGRTVHSMLRLVGDWHVSLEGGGADYSWTRLPLKPLLVEETGQERLEMPKRWHMTELTSSAQLRAEGTALRHCVASYANRCRRGVSSIWSLRLWQGERMHPLLTVEIDPRRRSVVQVRGRANRAASGKPLRLLQDWAVRERLQMNI